MSVIAVVHDFNPSPREDYKVEGDSSQTPSQSEITGGWIAIFALRLR